MKRMLVILITKVLYLIGLTVGKGSSLPGKLALRIYPNILSRLKLPENIVFVTGSNGKTTTSGMINDILVQNGYRVGYNFEGSNQIEGVATLLLRISNLLGKVKRDVLVLEVDERYSRHILKYITPKYYVVTNLYRDQLTRNGHPELVYSIITQGINDNTHLILNADDPLSSMLGMGKENVTYFGIDKNELSIEENSGMYNDGAYCPNCKAELEYDYYHYNHIGSYKCDKCGHAKQSPKFNVTEISFSEGNFVINHEHKIDLYFKSYYNIYNLLTAFTVANILGVDGEAICASLNNYIIKKERIIEFELNQNKGMLLLSKHENSISYDQSIMYAVTQDTDCTVLILIDSVSRKYFTSDTSWIWDIDFEKLNDEKVNKIILAGKYAYDLSVRFDHTGIDKDKLIMSPDLDNMITTLSESAVGNIYVITCFSDKNKFTERLSKWK
jgi:Zn ribbon nucleic-acid-binding protein